MVLPQVSKPEDLQEVGSKIRFLRKEKKMSQLELAEAIGVTQNTIYLIETGQSEMKLGKLFSIAEVLDVTPDKLLPNEARQHQINYLKLNIFGNSWVKQIKQLCIQQC